HFSLAAEYRDRDALAVPAEELAVDDRIGDAATLKVMPDLLRQRLVVLLRAKPRAVGECHAPHGMRVRGSRLEAMHPIRRYWYHVAGLLHSSRRAQLV